MAWNKPSTENPQQKKPNAKTPSAKRGIVAGAVVVVALGTLCLWMFSDRKSTSSSLQKRERGRIKDVTLVKSPASSNSAAIIQKDASSNAVEVLTVDAETAKEMRRREREAHRGLYVPSSEPPPVFKSPAERQIDGIVNARLGSNYYDYRVSPKFLDQFLQSLKTEIVINPDDPPDIVRRKERVIAAKKELSEAMKRGEDIVEIVKESKAELKKKFEDYMFFEKGLSELRRNKASKEEIADYALAAEKMMESKGIETRLRLGPDVRDLVKQYQKLIDQK